MAARPPRERTPRTSEPSSLAVSPERVLNVPRDFPGPENVTRPPAGPAFFHDAYLPPGQKRALSAAARIARAASPSWPASGEGLVPAVRHQLAHRGPSPPVGSPVRGLESSVYVFTVPVRSVQGSASLAASRREFPLGASRVRLAPRVRNSGCVQPPLLAPPVREPHLRNELPRFSLHAGGMPPGPALFLIGVGRGSAFLRRAEVSFRLVQAQPLDNRRRVSVENVCFRVPLTPRDFRHLIAREPPRRTRLLAGPDSSGRSRSPSSAPPAESRGTA